MQNIVYVDVLLVVNFVVNYFLIISAAKIISAEISVKRALCGALVGAFSAMSIFIPIKSAVFIWGVKIFTAILMVLIGFTYNGKKSFIYRILSLFAVSFIFSGFMLALWVFAPVGGMVYYNGIVYFNISTFKLFAFTIVCYILLSVFDRYIKSRSPKELFYRIYIEKEGKSVTLKAFMDTGNVLTEPFSGYPVIMVSLSSISGLLTYEEIIAIDKKDNELLKNMRIIPYSTVKGSGMINAFMPEKTILFGEKSSYVVEQIYVGITTETINIDGAEVLLNSGLCIEEKVLPPLCELGGVCK